MTQLRVVSCGAEVGATYTVFAVKAQADREEQSSIPPLLPLEGLHASEVHLLPKDQASLMTGKQRVLRKALLTRTPPQEHQEPVF